MATEGKTTGKSKQIPIRLEVEMVKKDQAKEQKEAPPKDKNK